jgi:hypothetical protein
MLGLSFWRKLARTNSTPFNLFLLAIMGCMVVNLVRGQTSYFIKYLYMFVLPGVLLYCALAGVKLRLVLGYPSARDRSAQSNPLSAAIQDPAPNGR